MERGSWQNILLLFKIIFHVYHQFNMSHENGAAGVEKNRNDLCKSRFAGKWVPNGNFEHFAMISRALNAKLCPLTISKLSWIDTGASVIITMCYVITIVICSRWQLICVSICKNASFGAICDEISLYVQVWILEWVSVSLILDFLFVDEKHLLIHGIKRNDEIRMHFARATINSPERSKYLASFMR